MEVSNWTLQFESEKLVGYWDEVWWAHILLLLLCGDVEANPGPGPGRRAGRPPTHYSININTGLRQTFIEMSTKQQVEVLTTILDVINIEYISNPMFKSEFTKIYTILGKAISDDILSQSLATWRL